MRAEAGYRAMMAGRPLVIEQTMNRVLAFGTRMAPRSLAARVAMKARERVPAS